MPRSIKIVRAKDEPSRCRLIVDSNSHQPTARRNAPAVPPGPTREQRQEDDREQHRRLRAHQFIVDECLATDRRRKKESDFRFAKYQGGSLVRNDPRQQQSHKQRQRGDKFPSRFVHARQQARGGHRALPPERQKRAPEHQREIRASGQRAE